MTIYYFDVENTSGDGFEAGGEGDVTQGDGGIENTSIYYFDPTKCEGEKLVDYSYKSIPKTVEDEKGEVKVVESP